VRRIGLQGCIQFYNPEKDEIMISRDYRALSALFVLTVLAAASPDVAKAQSATLRQACMSDYKLLCAGVSPGGGRGLACLQSQSDKLSAECKEAIAKGDK
jgi:hypothetical protein